MDMSLEQSIEDAARALLSSSIRQGQKLACAESCTGGLVAAALTAIPGSSAAFDRGFVTYSNDAKMEMLNVTAESLDRFGAVSEPVAKEMAYGVLTRSSADIAVSLTGIAGPDGGSTDKPVGLVWIGTARVGEAPTAVRCDFPPAEGRTAIRQNATLKALQLMADLLQ